MSPAKKTKRHALATPKKPQMPKGGEEEVSFTASGLYAKTLQQFNPDQLVGRKGLDIYRKMMLDDQVKAAVYAKLYAVLSTGYEIATPEITEEGADKEIADEMTDFGKFNFEDMAGSFDSNLYEIMTSVPYGFCLHGDTAINTPSGNFPIKDLVGKQPWVFSRIGNKVKLAQAKKVWLSKKNANCIKVTYRWWVGGIGRYRTESIICTDNHPFQTVRGFYRKAKHLLPGDRLAPFSQQIKLFGATPYKRKRAMLGVGEKWVTRAPWIWQQLHGQVPPGYVIHHKDGNTLNDDPSNLECLSRQQHVSNHSKEWFYNASREVLESRSRKVSAARQTPELQARLSAASTMANLKTWTDPVVRKRRIDGMTGKKRTGQALANLRAAYKNPERSRKISEAKKRYWAERVPPPGNHEVISIEPTNQFDVYDMEVPGTNNFAANGVFVHNSVTEKIYRLVDSGRWAGKIALKSLKTRQPFGFDFQTDGHGNLSENGVRQDQRPMPAAKFLIHSYHKMFGNHYGESDLRAAYEPWWRKSNANRFKMITLERYGEPLMDFSHSQRLSAENRAELQMFGQNLQNRSVLIHPDFIKLTLIQGDPKIASAFIPVIQEENVAIRIALLMPGLIGLSGEQAIGSFARAVKEFDAFIWVIEELRNDLETHINEQVIKPVIDLNYEVTDGKYPVFKFREITQEHRENVFNLWLKAVQTGGFTKTREDENKGRELIEFPKLPDDVPMAGEQPPNFFPFGKDSILSYKRAA